MLFKSPYPSLDIPKVDLLTYLFPDENAVSDKPIWLDSSKPELCLSPKALLRYVKRFMLGLDRLGVRPGEVVMIYTPNHIFVPVAYLGIVGGGRFFSGGNPAYTVSEMAHQMKDTGARIVLAHPKLVKTATAAADQAGIHRQCIYLFSDQPTQDDQVKDWRTILAPEREALDYSWKRMQGLEAMQTPATINYSSGTTGMPKGVCVSHHNIIANAEQTILARYAPDRSRNVPERWLGFLPLYHAYGQLWTIVMATKLTIPVYVMSQFVYEDFLGSIQRYRITHLQVAPPVIVMLAKRPETRKYDLSSVTDILCGAAPLSRELQNEVCKRFNVQINQGWGMTEVTCGAMVVPGGINDNTGSVGQLQPNTECRLLDDDGIEVKVGEPGELFVRGPQVCLRYHKNEAATKDSIDADGWLKTGDVAVVNDRGFFWIVDRKKELIKVNALQVAPAELEAALLQHDDIADAACVGIRLHDEEWPRAYVVLKEHAQGRISGSDIQSWIKPRVAKHKWLMGGVALVDEVPKLASGKIMRKKMREWAKRDVPVMESRGPVRVAKL